MRGGAKRGKSKHDPRYDQLMQAFDLVIFDEAHHASGSGEWYRVFDDLDAKYKIGFSATVFLEKTKEVERGILWLRAVCGPQKVQIEVSELVANGYLMRQNVRMYRVDKPD